jgi:signal transduction histidine kinase
VLRALATFGESASILAHEIEHPITAINVALEAVAQSLGEDHQAVLADLVGRLQRVERTLRRTLSFARPLELRRRPLAGYAPVRRARATWTQMLEEAPGAYPLPAARTLGLAPWKPRRFQRNKETAP